MNLIIDQGNSNFKFCFFSENKITQKIIKTIENNDFSFINKNIIKKVIYSTVSGYNSKLLEVLKGNEIIIFDNKTPLPIKNKYKSETIGLDRLAGAVGANYYFKNQNILLIDIGSAITFDVINYKNEFLGGNISPGLKLRFKALNQFTTNLPLLDFQEDDNLFADNTQQAVRLGVQNGILFEIETYINKFSTEYEDLKIIFTGGDINLFVKKIKNIIFAKPNLVAEGLNIILNYNT